MGQKLGGKGEQRRLEDTKSKIPGDGLRRYEKKTCYGSISGIKNQREREREREREKELKRERKREEEYILRGREETG